MATILNIETAGNNASVCISVDDVCVGYLENPEQKEHASFIHHGIERLLTQTGYELQQMDAVAVTSGPGSYTGLRVGMATAKGICYTLGKPLITVNTLLVMARSAIASLGSPDTSMLFCPMIDARRMEVFTAIYNIHLEEVVQPHAAILDGNTFNSFITQHKLAVFGSGSSKFLAINKSQNLLAVDADSNALMLAIIAFRYFQAKNFADISYSQPNYLKEFYQAGKNQS